MRAGRWVATGAVVVSLLTAGGLTAPAARAASQAPAGRGAPAASAASTAAASARRAVVKSAPAGVSSRLAELASAATGADLWSRSSVTKRPIGSIAKVMTAYVVLTTPGLNLNRLITVPAGVVGYDEAYDASTAGLEPGEKVTTRQLLYAMMLPSGCDAAYTLAAHYGPGRSGFIAKMNKAAKKLGMSKTHFTDFSGLPDPSEYSTYSTVHDLLILGRGAMKSKTFAAVVSTRTYRLAAGSGHRSHVWRNLNPLLGRYPGAVGIKTGYTRAAGQCLLFEARRGSKVLIGVVLDSSTVNSATLTAAAADATTLLNWGFRR
jgi:D-alanyl-D-alanine carboxypeptidase (penicillin-binding protein 5/6)